jgi:hypothetical protein
MPFVWFFLGAALVALTLLDIFQTVLVPRLAPERVPEPLVLAIVGSGVRTFHSIG